MDQNKSWIQLETHIWEIRTIYLELLNIDFFKRADESSLYHKSWSLKYHTQSSLITVLRFSDVWSVEIFKMSYENFIHLWRYWWEDDFRWNFNLSIFFKEILRLDVLENYIGRTMPYYVSEWAEILTVLWMDMDFIIVVSFICHPTNLLMLIESCVSLTISSPVSISHH